MDTERGLDVCHVVLETGHHHLVAPGTVLRVPFPGVVAHPMEVEYAHSLCELPVCGGNHPSFAGGHVLGGVEGEHADQSRRDAAAALGVTTDRASPVRGADGMRGVGHDGEATPLGDRENRFEFAALAAKVHGHNGSRTRRY